MPWAQIRPGSHSTQRTRQWSDRGQTGTMSLRLAMLRTKGTSVGGVLPKAEELRRQLQRDGSLVLNVKVIPRSHTGEVAERMANGALKIKVTAVPERGRANNEVCELLAGYLDVPKRNVEVIFGHASPQKRVKVLR